MVSFTFRSLIFIIFFFSGAAGLVYQVAWQRALTLYYGVGAVSTAIVVSIFLLGLGLGSLLGGWVAEKVKARIGLYFGIEIAIGLCGIASLALFSSLLPVLGELSLLSGFFAITIALLIPTLLMGMTLPLVLKILNEIGQDPGHSLSQLYFVNTLGASVGAFVGTYVLMSFFGISGAVKYAAYMNFALAGVVLLALLVHKVGAKSLLNKVRAAPALAQIGFDQNWKNYGAVFTTGFLAIGYQMIWFRVLTVLLKPSAYMFSTILAVYLAGIAIGSLWMSLRIKKLHTRRNHKQTFFKINAWIAITTFITFSVLYWGAEIKPLKWMLETTTGHMLHPPYNPLYAIKGDTWAEKWPTIYLFWDVIMWPALIVLPSTILMGASFPLISAMAIESSKKEAWKTGTIYLTNILGNVLGALVTGFILFPLLGTEITLKIFTVIGLLWLLGLTKFGRFQLTRRKAAILTGVLAVLAVTILPGRTDLYVALHDKEGLPERLITENIDGVVMSYHTAEKGREASQIMINGSPQASYPGAAYRLEVLEAVTYAKSVDKVLVIGFGGGDLTNTLLMLPEVKDITVVELSRALTDNVNQLSIYDEILSDPRLTYIVEDGRRFLYNTDEKFDLVLMDPLRAQTAYSNNIYSQEFFALVRSRLNDDGALMTWFNEYRIIPNTLASVYDYMQCFYYFCVSSPSEMTPDTRRADYLWEQFSPSMQKGINARRNVKRYVKGDRDVIVKAGKGDVNHDLEPLAEYYIGYNLKRHFARKRARK